jgi:hypothetical protein
VKKIHSIPIVASALCDHDFFDDNNFPFSVGRHVGSDRPNDDEFIINRLDQR